MTKTSGPEFLKYCEPVIETLREIGGSGRPAEVTDMVIDKLGIPEAEQEVVNKNGGSRVRNQIAWARFYLVKAGLLDSSQRGVWELTGKGRGMDLKALDIHAMFRDVQSTFKGDRKARKQREPDIDTTGLEAEETPDSYRTQLLANLQSLPPEGFERLCQRLLRESGFQQVKVTGRSGDGGIDGHGILQLNPLVSFRVLFQCKRYQGAVAVSAVRDFRGALQGRADKGIILTTGTFTTDARREALRDGATPIELVDGEKLVEMFENLQLGLRPKKDFEVVEEFFEPYR